MMMSLHYLDISSNRLNSTDLDQFLSLIDGKNHIRTLKIGYNSSETTGLSIDDDQFIYTLSDFIHYADSLLHIDLSGMSFKLEKLIYLA